jgi:hypothetical protein
LKGINDSGISWNWSGVVLAFIGGAIVTDEVGEVVTRKEVLNLGSFSLRQVIAK